MPIVDLHGEVVLPDVMDELLQGERARLQAEVEARLDTTRRLRAWLKLDLPSAVRLALSTELSTLREELVDALLAWQDVGGCLEVGMPCETESHGAPTEPHKSAPDGAGATPEVVVDAAPPTEPTVPHVVEAVEAVDVPEDSNEPDATRTEAAQNPPPTDQQLAALQRHFAVGPPTPEILPQDWHRDLDVVLSGLTPSSSLDEEERRVCGAAMACARWSRFPKAVQRLLIGYVASRLRSLQDEAGRAGAAISRAFSQLTAYSARERPGFVFGLARAHRPTSGSWSEDADGYWEELADLLPAADDTEPTVGALLRDVEAVVPEIDAAPVEMRPTLRRQAVRLIREALEGGVRARNTRLVNLAAPLLDDLEGREFRTLRRAIRERLQQPVEGSDDSGDVLPTDWGWWACTRGRRALLVGGDPREPNRQRLQEVFGFESLDWLATAGKPQALQAIAGRIRQGTVDLLIVLTRFVGHNYDDVLLPACRDAGVPWVSVDHGYGVGRVRLAIERFLDAEECRS